jgi:hypothetical protein
MHNVSKFAPGGIDLRARIIWANARQLGRSMKRDLAAVRSECSFDLEKFEVMCAAYCKGIKRFLDDHQHGKGLHRLLRAYISHFRRSLIDEVRTTAMLQRAAVMVLMGQNL